MAESERCARIVDRLAIAPQSTGSWWTGPSAGAFSDRLAETSAELTEAQRVLRVLVEVLDQWATTMLANQRRAEQFDQQALRLRRMLDAASDHLDNAATVAQFSSEPGAEAQRRDAAARYENLRRQLDRVLNSARMLERDHLAAARQVTQRLRALGSGGVIAATQVPGRAELFAGVTGTLENHSRLAGELARVLPGARDSRNEPAAGATAAFISGLVE